MHENIVELNNPQPGRSHIPIPPSTIIDAQKPRSGLSFWKLIIAVLVSDAIGIVAIVAVCNWWFNQHYDVRAGNHKDVAFTALDDIETTGLNVKASGNAAFQVITSDGSASVAVHSQASFLQVQSSESSTSTGAWLTLSNKKTEHQLGVDTASDDFTMLATTSATQKRTDEINGFPSPVAITLQGTHNVTIGPNTNGSAAGVVGNSSFQLKLESATTRVSGNQVIGGHAHVQGGSNSINGAMSVLLGSATLQDAAIGQAVVRQNTSMRSGLAGPTNMMVTNMSVLGETTARSISVEQGNTSFEQVRVRNSSTVAGAVVLTGAIAAPGANTTSVGLNITRGSASVQGLRVNTHTVVGSLAGITSANVRLASVNTSSFVGPLVSNFSSGTLRLQNNMTVQDRNFTLYQGFVIAGQTTVKEVVAQNLVSASSLVSSQADIFAGTVVVHNATHVGGQVTVGPVAGMQAAQLEVKSSSLFAGSSTIASADVHTQPLQVTANADVNGTLSVASATRCVMDATVQADFLVHSVACPSPHALFLGPVQVNGAFAATNQADVNGTAASDGVVVSGGKLAVFGDLQSVGSPALIALTSVATGTIASNVHIVRGLSAQGVVTASSSIELGGNLTVAGTLSTLSPLVVPRSTLTPLLVVDRSSALNLLDVHGGSHFTSTVSVFSDAQLQSGASVAGFVSLAAGATAPGAQVLSGQTVAHNLLVLGVANISSASVSAEHKLTVTGHVNVDAGLVSSPEAVFHSTIGCTMGVAVLGAASIAGTTACQDAVSTADATVRGTLRVAQTAITTGTVGCLQHTHAYGGLGTSSLVAAADAMCSAEFSAGALVVSSGGAHLEGSVRSQSSVNLANDAAVSRHANFGDSSSFAQPAVLLSSLSTAGQTAFSSETQVFGAFAVSTNLTCAQTATVADVTASGPVRAIAGMTVQSGTVNIGDAAFTSLAIDGHLDTAGDSIQMGGGLVVQQGSVLQGNATVGGHTLLQRSSLSVLGRFVAAASLDAVGIITQGMLEIDSTLLQSSGLDVSTGDTVLQRATIQQAVAIGVNLTVTAAARHQTLAATETTFASAQVRTGLQTQGTLTVASASYLASNLSVSGLFHAHSNFTAAQSTLGGQLVCAGGARVGQLTTAGLLTVGRVTVQGSSNTMGTLDCASDLYAQSNATVAQAAVLTGSTMVGGAVALHSLGVQGQALFQGALTVEQMGTFAAGLTVATGYALTVETFQAQQLLTAAALVVANNTTTELTRVSNGITVSPGARAVIGEAEVLSLSLLQPLHLHNRSVVNSLTSLGAASLMGAVVVGGGSQITQGLQVQAITAQGDIQTGSLTTTSASVTALDTLGFAQLDGGLVVVGGCATQSINLLLDSAFASVTVSGGTGTNTQSATIGGAFLVSELNSAHITTVAAATVASISSPSLLATSGNVLLVGDLATSQPATFYTLATPVGTTPFATAGAVSLRHVDSNGQTNFHGPLTLQSWAQFRAGVTLQGATTLQRADVSQNAAVQENLSVSGSSIAQAPLTVTGNVAIGGEAVVVGSTTLTSTVATAGLATFGAGLTATAGTGILAAESVSTSGLLTTASLQASPLASFSQLSASGFMAADLGLVVNGTMGVAGSVVCSQPLTMPSGQEVGVPVLTTSSLTAAGLALLQNLTIAAGQPISLQTLGVTTAQTNTLDSGSVTAPQGPTSIADVFQIDGTLTSTSQTNLQSVAMNGQLDIPGSLSTPVLGMVGAVFASDMLRVVNLDVSGSAANVVAFSTPTVAVLSGGLTVDGLTQTSNLTTSGLLSPNTLTVLTTMNAANVNLVSGTLTQNVQATLGTTAFGDGVVLGTYTPVAGRLIAQNTITSIVNVTSTLSIDTLTVFGSTNVGRITAAAAFQTLPYVPVQTVTFFSGYGCTGSSVTYPTSTSDFSFCLLVYPNLASLNDNVKSIQSNTGVSLRVRINCQSTSFVLQTVTFTQTNECVDMTDARGSYVSITNQGLTGLEDTGMLVQGHTAVEDLAASAAVNMTSDVYVQRLNAHGTLSNTAGGLQIAAPTYLTISPYAPATGQNATDITLVAASANTAAGRNGGGVEITAGSGSDTAAPTANGGQGGSVLFDLGLAGYSTIINSYYVQERGTDGQAAMSIDGSSKLFIGNEQTMLRSETGVPSTLFFKHETTGGVYDTSFIIQADPVREEFTITNGAADEVYLRVDSSNGVNVGAPGKSLYFSNLAHTEASSSTFLNINRNSAAMAAASGQVSCTANSTLLSGTLTRYSRDVVVGDRILVEPESAWIIFSQQNITLDITDSRITPSNNGTLFNNFSSPLDIVIVNAPLRDTFRLIFQSNSTQVTLTSTEDVHWDTEDLVVPGYKMTVSPPSNPSNTITLTISTAPNDTSNPQLVTFAVTAKPSRSSVSGGEAVKLQRPQFVREVVVDTSSSPARTHLKLRETFSSAIFNFTGEQHAVSRYFFSREVLSILSDQSVRLAQPLSSQHSLLFRPYYIQTQLIAATGTTGDFPFTFGMHGQLGLGTVSPQDWLHVDGAAARHDASMLFVSDSTAPTTLMLLNSNTSTIALTGSGDLMLFRSSDDLRSIATAPDQSNHTSTHYELATGITAFGVNGSVLFSTDGSNNLLVHETMVENRRTLYVDSGSYGMETANENFTFASDLFILVNMNSGDRDAKFVSTRGEVQLLVNGQSMSTLQFGDVHTESLTRDREIAIASGPIAGFSTDHITTKQREWIPEYFKGAKFAIPVPASGGSLFLSFYSQDDDTTVTVLVGGIAYASVSVLRRHTESISIAAVAGQAIEVTSTPASVIVALESSTSTSVFTPIAPVATKLVGFCHSTVYLTAFSQSTTVDITCSDGLETALVVPTGSSVSFTDAAVNGQSCTLVVQDSGLIGAVAIDAVGALSSFVDTSKMATQFAIPPIGVASLELASLDAASVTFFSASGTELLTTSTTTSAASQGVFFLHVTSGDVALDGGNYFVATGAPVSVRLTTATSESTNLFGACSQLCFDVGSAWHPASSCWAVLESDASKPNGRYWLDPDGSEGIAPFQVDCYMLDGVGWMGFSLNHTGTCCDFMLSQSNSNTNPWNKCADNVAQYYDFMPADTNQQSWYTMSGGNGDFQYALFYTSPSTRAAYTDAQMDSIRAIIGQLHDSTRMVATTADDDNSNYDSGASSGMEVYVRSSGLTQTKLLTPGYNGDCGGGAGSWPAANSESAFYLWGTSSSQTSGDIVVPVVLSPLETQFILPAQVELQVHTGGGVSFGYMEAVILVAEATVADVVLAETIDLTVASSDSGSVVLNTDGVDVFSTSYASSHVVPPLITDVHVTALFGNDLRVLAEESSLVFVSGTATSGGEVSVRTDGSDAITLPRGETVNLWRTLYTAGLITLNVTSTDLLLETPQRTLGSAGDLTFAIGTDNSGHSQEFAAVVAGQRYLRVADDNVRFDEEAIVAGLITQGGASGSSLTISTPNVAGTDGGDLMLVAGLGPAGNAEYSFVAGGVDMAHFNETLVVIQDRIIASPSIQKQSADFLIAANVSNGLTLLAQTDASSVALLVGSDTTPSNAAWETQINSATIRRSIYLTNSLPQYTILQNTTSPVSTNVNNVLTLQSTLADVRSVAQGVVTIATTAVTSAAPILLQPGLVTSNRELALTGSLTYSSASNEAAFNFTTADNGVVGALSFINLAIGSIGNSDIMRVVDTNVTMNTPLRVLHTITAAVGQTITALTPSGTDLVLAPGMSSGGSYDAVVNLITGTANVACSASQGDVTLSLPLQFNLLPASNGTWITDLSQGRNLTIGTATVAVPGDSGSLRFVAGVSVGGGTPGSLVVKQNGTVGLTVGPQDVSGVQSIVTGQVSVGHTIDALDVGQTLTFSTSDAPNTTASGWQLVFRQTFSEHLFADEAEAASYLCTSDVAAQALLPTFSCLSQLESFRALDGGFTFRLAWPTHTAQENIWTQASNPVTTVSGGVSGYVDVSSSFTGYGWGGLEQNVLFGQSLLDGNVANSPAINWFAVGAIAGRTTPCCACDPSKPCQHQSLSSCLTGNANGCPTSSVFLNCTLDATIPLCSNLPDFSLGMAGPDGTLVDQVELYVLSPTSDTGDIVVRFPAGDPARSISMFGGGHNMATIAEQQVSFDGVTVGLTGSLSRFNGTTLDVLGLSLGSSVSVMTGASGSGTNGVLQLELGGATAVELSDASATVFAPTFSLDSSSGVVTQIAGSDLKLSTVDTLDASNASSVLFQGAQVLLSAGHNSGLVIASAANSSVSGTMALQSLFVEGTNLLLGGSSIALTAGVSGTSTHGVVSLVAPLSRSVISTGSDVTIDAPAVSIAGAGFAHTVAGQSLTLSTSPSGAGATGSLVLEPGQSSATTNGRVVLTDSAASSEFLVVSDAAVTVRPTLQIRNAVGLKFGPESGTTVSWTTSAALVPKTITIPLVDSVFSATVTAPLDLTVAGGDLSLLVDPDGGLAAGAAITTLDPTNIVGTGVIDSGTISPLFGSIDITTNPLGAGRLTARGLAPLLLPGQYVPGQPNIALALVGSPTLHVAVGVPNGVSGTAAVGNQNTIISIASADGLLTLNIEDVAIGTSLTGNLQLEMGNITAVGVVASGLIDQGFGNIDIGTLTVDSGVLTLLGATPLKLKAALGGDVSLGWTENANSDVLVVPAKTGTAIPLATAPMDVTTVPGVLELVRDSVTAFTLDGNGALTYSNIVQVGVLGAGEIAVFQQVNTYDALNLPASTVAAEQLTVRTNLTLARDGSPAAAVTMRLHSGLTLGQSETIVVPDSAGAVSFVIGAQLPLMQSAASGDVGLDISPGLVLQRGVNGLSLVQPNITSTGAISAGKIQASSFPVDIGSGSSVTCGTVTMNGLGTVLHATTLTSSPTAISLALVSEPGPADETIVLPVPAVSGTLAATATAPVVVSASTGDLSLSIGLGLQISSNTLATKMTDITTVGALVLGSITSSFSSIDVSQQTIGSGQLTASSLVLAGATQVGSQTLAIPPATVGSWTHQVPSQGSGTLVASATQPLQRGTSSGALSLSLASSLTTDGLSALTMSFATITTVDVVSSGSIHSGFGDIDVSTNSVRAGALTVGSGGVVLNRAPRSVSLAPSPADPAQPFALTVPTLSTGSLVVSATAPLLDTAGQLDLVLASASGLSVQSPQGSLVLVPENITVASALTAGSILPPFGSINIGTNDITAGVATVNSRDAFVFNPATFSVTMRMLTPLTANQVMAVPVAAAGTFVVQAAMPLLIGSTDGSVALNWVDSDFFANTQLFLAMQNITTVGSMSVGSIAAGFGSIHVGSQTLESGSLSVIGLSPVLFEGAVANGVGVTLALTADPSGGQRTLGVPVVQSGTLALGATNALQLGADGTVSLLATTGEALDATGSSLAMVLGEILEVGALATGSIAGPFGTVDIGTNSLSCGVTTLFGGSPLVLQGTTNTVTLSLSSTTPTAATTLIVPVAVSGTVVKSTTAPLTLGSSGQVGLSFVSGVLTLSGSNLALNTALITTVGQLVSGQITSFGSISIGASTVTADTLALSASSTLKFDGTTTGDGNTVTLSPQDTVAGSFTISVPATATTGTLTVAAAAPLSVSSSGTLALAVDGTAGLATSTSVTLATSGWTQVGQLTGGSIASLSSINIPSSQASGAAVTIPETAGSLTLAGTTWGVAIDLSAAPSSNLQFQIPADSGAQTFAVAVGASTALTLQTTTGTVGINVDTQSFSDASSSPLKLIPSATSVLTSGSIAAGFSDIVLDSAKSIASGTFTITSAATSLTIGNLAIVLEPTTPTGAHTTVVPVSASGTATAQAQDPLAVDTATGLVTISLDGSGLLVVSVGALTLQMSSLTTVALSGLTAGSISSTFGTIAVGAQPLTAGPLTVSTTTQIVLEGSTVDSVSVTLVYNQASASAFAVTLPVLAGTIAISTSNPLQLDGTYGTLSLALKASGGFVVQSTQLVLDAAYQTTTVGALSSGQITSFGSIDIGTDALDAGVFTSNALAAFSFEGAVSGNSNAVAMQLSGEPSLVSTITLPVVSGTVTTRAANPVSLVSGQVSLMLATGGALQISSGIALLPSEITSTGAMVSGSISSTFGDINIGSSALTGGSVQVATSGPAAPSITFEGDTVGDGSLLSFSVSTLSFATTSISIAPPSSSKTLPVSSSGVLSISGTTGSVSLSVSAPVTTSGNVLSVDISTIGTPAAPLHVSSGQISTGFGTIDSTTSSVSAGRARLSSLRLVPLTACTTAAPGDTCTVDLGTGLLKRALVSISPNLYSPTEFGANPLNVVLSNCAAGTEVVVMTNASIVVAPDAPATCSPSATCAVTSVPSANKFVCGTGGAMYTTYRDTTPPSGYTIVFVTNPITSGNNVKIRTTSAELSTTYNFVMYNQAFPATTMTGSGQITTATQTISGIDATGLASGTIQVDFTLTDSSGNVGAVVSATVTKN